MAFKYSFTLNDDDAWKFLDIIDQEKISMLRRSASGIMDPREYDCVVKRIRSLDKIRERITSNYEKIPDNPEFQLPR